MKPLIVSISGVRGISGEGLTDGVVARFACAFGEFLGGGLVAVANDGRKSRRMCFEALARGLAAGGCKIAYLGTAPTPTLQLAVPELKAAGGVCITASHNPEEWNGLKFYTGEGILLDESAVESVISVFESLSAEAVLARVSGREAEIEPAGSAVDTHISRILGQVDAGLIRSKKFKIAVDPVNGAGSVITEKLLDALGCETVKIHYGITGSFSREPEPLPSNLSALRKAVLDSGADAGFAQDPDADRLALVTEDGECPGEDYSLALAVKYVASKTPGPVVTTLSTTRAVDDVCKEFRCPVLRTKVGERNVIGLMREHKAVIGGEGNGGIIWPAVHYGRDSLAGIGLILQYMAETGMKLSRLVSSVPKYSIIKKKIGNRRLKPVGEIISSGVFSGAQIDTTDGVKASWDNSWAHIRASGTEPVVRVIVEAGSEAEALGIYEKLVPVILQAVPD